MDKVLFLICLIGCIKSNFIVKFTEYLNENRILSLIDEDDVTISSKITDFATIHSSNMTLNYLRNKYNNISLIESITAN